MNFNKKMFLMILLAFSLLLSGCNGGSSNGNSSPRGDVVAIVNGENIYSATLDEYVTRALSSDINQGLDIESEEGQEMKAQAESQLLTYLVQERVLLQAAEKNNISISDEEVESELQLIKGNFPSEEDFNNALVQSSLTIETFRESLKNEMTIDLFLEESTPEISVSEEDLLEYYNSYQEYMDNFVKDNPDMSEEEMEMFKLPAFEEIRDSLEMELIQEKMQVHNMELIDNLMESSEIEILI